MSHGNLRCLGLVCTFPGDSLDSLLFFFSKASEIVKGCGHLRAYLGHGFVCSSACKNIGWLVGASEDPGRSHKKKNTGSDLQRVFQRDGGCVGESVDEHFEEL